MQVTQQTVDFARIKQAIEYIDARFRDQPGLEELAAHVGLSPFHFQRLFREWAGVSPKKFLQYTTLAYTKSILNDQPTLFDASLAAGLSGTGRLHDLFVSIEAMTPAEYRDAGKDLSIQYSFQPSPFGQVLVASTSRGICQLAFTESRTQALESLKKQFGNARVAEEMRPGHLEALRIFREPLNNTNKIRLHLKGTPFQLKVWEGLLKIPVGRLTSYGALARTIDTPSASRAVGSAIGKNPVAYLIPCHRVIQSTGAFGGYMWGPTRKKAIIAWENSRVET